MAAHASPVSVERGRLTVSVDDPTWASQLRWSESDVLRRLGELCGPDVVTSIATRVRRR
jgi:predicted nucleic acid-binding Zn ribbon protein